MKELFDEFATTEKLQAQLEELSAAMPHEERAARAVEASGASVVRFDGLWAVAVGGLPKDRPLKVVGELMPVGEFVSRFRFIDVVVREDVEVATSSEVLGIMCDSGGFLCVDVNGMRGFRPAAPAQGFRRLLFWKQPKDDWQKLLVDLDEAKEGGLGLRLMDARACAFLNRWGDGIYTVHCDRDAAGEIVRIRIDTGTEERCELLHALMEQLTAVVSKAITVQGKPPYFVSRAEPTHEHDSGWSVMAGTETDEEVEDPNNYELVSIAKLADHYPAFAAVMDARLGSRFHLDRGVFVAGE